MWKSLRTFDTCITLNVAKPQLQRKEREMSSVAGWQTTTVNSADVQRLAVRGVLPHPQTNAEIPELDLSVPASFDFLGFNWHVLNAPLAVSFGGTLSPCTDAHQLAILLAQAVVNNSDAREAVVVSGGGRGIDTAAHLGALDMGGKTIAVLANPVGYGLHPYIPRRSLLERSILAHRGGFVSEYRTYVENYMERAVDRGRIITALSDMFIAIECSSNSTTVDCATRAKRQGRAVLAIDWAKFGKLHHQPKVDGFEALVSSEIGEPFPQSPVRDVTDPALREQFQERLHILPGIA